MTLNSLFKLFDELQSMAWWKELLIIWIISFVIVRIIIPAIKKYIIEYPLIKHNKKVIDSFCNKNLKPNVIFLDHAPIPGLYVLSQSAISISSNDEFTSSTEFLKAVEQNNIMEYRSIDNKTNNCYGVKHFSYNRLQEVEADEAHWFNISLYKTDCFTRAMLKTWLNNSKAKNNKPTDPTSLNKLFPFVLEFRVALHLYYQSRLGNYYILSQKPLGFIIEHEFSADDMSQHCNGEVLIDLTNKLLESQNFILETQINDNGCFTDFALDYDNMVLYLIGNVQISRPPIRSRYKKYSTRKVRNTIVKSQYNTDYQELFLYSSCNLFSRIANKDNK